jgi:hypothetical protein
MSIRFKLEVLGETQFDRAFDRADLAITDFSDTWDEVRDEFYAIEREQFASEGAAGESGKWQKLSSPYEEIKSKKYPGKGILRRTDAMYKALTSHTSDSIFEKSKDEMAIGTSLPYPILHQKGAGKLPEREPVSFSQTQKRRLQKRIQLSLLEQVKKAGFETD